MRFRTQAEGGTPCSLLGPALLLSAGLLALVLTAATQHGARLTQAFCPAHNITDECMGAARQLLPGGQQAAGGGAATGWRAGRPDPGWAPLLGERQINKGILTYGDTARTRRLAAKLLRGEPITAAVGSSRQGETDWSSVLFAWLRAQFPANHTTVNGAVPATPSSYMSLCVHWHVPEEADLVIVEYNINDGAGDRTDPVRAAHERLLRKLLSFKNRPAVMEITFYRRPDAWAQTAPGANDYYRDVPWAYRVGGDEELAALAAYYHLPLFSCRNLMWDLSAALKPDPKHYWEAWTADQDHPNDLGHRYMADMVISFISRALDNLDRHPLDEEDEQAAAAELVPPMFKNVAAVLAYLVSYEHMGQAEVSCVSGCNCTTYKLDGHITERVSQTSMQTMELSRAEKCRLRITILNETSSGEHKVKVMGLIISEPNGWLLTTSMPLEYRGDSTVEFVGR
ncbi:hypothetical protein C2E21_0584 [Chlorella sorokiniana]|uniref:SGNH hydrolase-type esterase domain-containing protein n=1 Tax=Chlorella sorokiniana TaxID=3076 RepID=A0A2P6U474_CHLSO|nr:hypothetical protein C2E21_0584 [Chlorella sorokiniana]|eukprot:PRW61115.1 hypothetical protein C2E21_0584 [Chlorella sorokiniana]